MQKNGYFCEIEPFAHYIAQSFEKSFRTEPVRDPGGLPLYLRGGFQFFLGELGSQMFLWAKLVDEENKTPEVLRNQKTRLERFFDLPVVFVFDHLDNWQRSRLIGKHVPFVQANKQIYIPELFLHLDDTRSARTAEETRPEHLSYPSQLILLYHLLRSSLNGQPAFQIALDLGYSAMTVTRVIRQLQQLRLIEVRSGKEKAFDFNYNGENLWNESLKFLRNPLKEVWYSHALNGMTGIMESGETALAQYSMLAGPRVKEFAMGKEMFRSLRTLDRLPELDKRYGNYRIEVWQYNPAVLAEPGGPVDRLSLYLCLRESSDERVMGALEEAMSGVIW